MTGFDAAVAHIVTSAAVGRAGWKAQAIARATAIVTARQKEWIAASLAVARASAYRSRRHAVIAAKAVDDAQGIIRLEHGPYGPSYFGSGGAYGRCRAVNCVVELTGDNGFISGPAAFRVVDRSQEATVTAAGGDCIGEEGRSWSEAYDWDPVTQVWGTV